MTYYTPAHASQYAPGASAITRTSGCTWTSAATGLDASTGGRKKLAPDLVHALVKRSEEVNPETPGWQMGDVAKAMGRVGESFVNRTGQGWGAVELAHRSGLYVLLQGDSDRFGDGTCSGKFDGDHCVGIGPQEDKAGRWRTDDPICPSARYEDPKVLRAYAEKLSPRIFFGVFTRKVPSVDLPDTSTRDPDMPGMKLSKVRPFSGRVELTREWTPWDPETDTRTSQPLAKGGVYRPLATCEYHGEFPGFVILNNERMLVLPSGDSVGLKVEPDPPPGAREYPVVVTVGGKAPSGGKVTLP